MITIKHISKEFDKRHVLNNIDFIFEQGKCNLIIGSSGSGKNSFNQMFSRLN